MARLRHKESAKEQPLAQRTDCTALLGWDGIKSRETIIRWLSTETRRNGIEVVGGVRMELF